ncbi:MAG: hypothetical protein K9L68_09820 [Spirochaetales bacterium]|nr:hypothetical protein [Spirochaetales bacterium]
MESKHPLWLTQVFTRIHIFLFFILIAFVWLYILGNMQNFTDPTNNLLINLTRTIGLAASLTGSAAFILQLFACLSHHDCRKAALWLLPFSALASLLAAAISGFLYAFFQGVD